MKPTIKDVAKKAKVSVATVSRILNEQPGYTLDTKQKVLDVIEELGYKPNAIARGLVKRDSRTLGVLMPNLRSNFMSELLNGIVNGANNMLHSVIVCNTGAHGKDTLEYIHQLAEQQVKGIIFASEQVTDAYAEAFRVMKAPVILISTISDRHPIPYIRVDDRQAAFQATKYLIEKGHRHIGFMGGIQNSDINSTPRLAGYKQAMQEFGLPCTDKQIVYGEFSYTVSSKMIEVLLKQFPQMTAVFAISDEMAIGILKYAYLHGIRIPDELSVIGYDDTLLAEMSVPSLTTVHQPIYDMGKQAVEMVLDEKQRSMSIVMPYHIVERDTVKTLR